MGGWSHWTIKTSKCPVGFLHFRHVRSWQCNPEQNKTQVLPLWSLLSSKRVIQCKRNHKGTESRMQLSLPWITTKWYPEPSSPQQQELSSWDTSQILSLHYVVKKTHKQNLLPMPRRLLSMLETSFYHPTLLLTMVFHPSLALITLFLFIKILSLHFIG
jgi:hypothetical protein